MNENPYEAPQEKPGERMQRRVWPKVVITLYLLLVGAVVVSLALLLYKSLSFAG